jgi:uncharacterized protein (TIGR00369 family)
MTEGNNQKTLGPEELNSFLSRVFPGAEKIFSVDRITDDGLILKCRATERHLRPGGTVSGPLLMTMADTAMYLVILSRVGLVAMAVTTNLNISFLRKAPMGELIGHTRLLKLGSRLAVGDVTIHHIDDPRPVAHASVTYSIPPREA